MFTAELRTGWCVPFISPKADYSLWRHAKDCFGVTTGARRSTCPLWQVCRLPGGRNHQWGSLRPTHAHRSRVHCCHVRFDQDHKIEALTVVNQEALRAKAWSVNQLAQNQDDIYWFQRSQPCGWGHINPYAPMILHNFHRTHYLLPRASSALCKHRLHQRHTNLMQMRTNKITVLSAYGYVAVLLPRCRSRVWTNLTDEHNLPSATYIGQVDSAMLLWSREQKCRRSPASSPCAVNNIVWDFHPLTAVCRLRWYGNASRLSSENSNEIVWISIRSPPCVVYVGMVTLADYHPHNSEQDRMRRRPAHCPLAPSNGIPRVQHKNTNDKTSGNLVSPL